MNNANTITTITATTVVASATTTTTSISKSGQQLAGSGSQGAFSR